MAADQARLEAQEVPFGARGVEHVSRADADAIEDHRQLVHERDVQIALCVLDGLGSFGDLDRLSAVNTRFDDAAIHVGDPLQGFRVLARNHFDDALERVLVIPWIDTLGRVAELEIDVALEARAPGEERTADVFRHARVHRGFVDDHTARLEHARDRLRGAQHRREIRHVVRVDRGGYGDDEEGGFRELLHVRRHLEGGALELLLRTLPGRVHSAAQRVNALLVDIEADRVRKPLGQRQSDREADVPQANDCNPLVHRGALLDP
jgi:hypothetical protein